MFPAINFKIWNIFLEAAGVMKSTQTDKRKNNLFKLEGVSDNVLQERSRKWTADK